MSHDANRPRLRGDSRTRPRRHRPRPRRQRLARVPITLTHDSSWAWQKRREWWQAHLPYPCPLCGHDVTPDDPTWELHHLDEGDARSDMETAPSHRSCNRADGLRRGLAKRNAARGGKSDDDARFLGDAVGYGDTDRRVYPPPHPDRPEPPAASPDALDVGWDTAEWLQELRTFPADATWPRYMSAPHPRAVGSYGPDFVRWVRERHGVTLRWWQRLAAYRVLEHDDDGELVWLVWLISTPRQVGKSWWLRALFLWRIHQGDRFGEPQLVMHTGKDLPVCREVQRPARAWARRLGYKVRETNGQEEIETPDGSRWMVRGRDSVYGYSASLGAVDEAWHVEPGVVDDGLEPTMAERSSPQLGLVSTAHRLATSLMPGRRRAALAELAAPEDTLVIEWSAPPLADMGDPGTWRAASPHWSDKRERLVTSKWARALAGTSDDPDEPDPVEAFRAQWLNVWPDRAAPKPTKDEPLLPEGAWADAADLTASAVGPVVIAVEDFFGKGAAAAACGVTGDGRLIVWGETFTRRADAFGWASLVCAQRPGSRLIVGGSLVGDELAATVSVVSVDAAGVAETKRGLPLLRELVASHGLVHDGGTSLAGQVGATWVTPLPSGLVPSSRAGRTDLVRCASWCVVSASRTTEPAPLDFFVY